MRLQQFGQRFTHLWTKVRTLQSERDVGLKEADAVTAIVSGALKAQAMEWLCADQTRHAVCKLNFIASAALLTVEMGEQLGLKNIAADDRQSRRRYFRLRLFDQTLDRCQPAIVGLDIQDAVAVGLLTRHI